MPFNLTTDNTPTTTNNNANEMYDIITDFASDTHIADIIKQRVEKVFDGKTKALNSYNAILTYIAAEVIITMIEKGDVLLSDSTATSISRNINAHFNNLTVNGTHTGIIPDQSSNTGKFLTTDGTYLSWATPSGGTKPLFQVIGQNTTQATGGSGIYKLIYWNIPTIDQEAGSYGWDSANSQYRCPITGNYRVTALVHWQGNNITDRGIAMYIYINNGQYNSIFTATTFHDVPGQPEYQFATLNLIIPCSQGDTIDIRSDAVTNLIVYYNSCHFNVEFIQ